MKGTWIVVGFVCALSGCEPKVHPLVASDIAASQEQALIDRGRYLVNGPMHCAECHGAKKARDGGFVTDPDALDGGIEMAIGPMGTLRFANIAPMSPMSVSMHSAS